MNEPRASAPSAYPGRNGDGAPAHDEAPTALLLTHEPFIGHLAHALRSALNAIRGWSAVIEDRCPAGPAGAVVERAISGINTGVDQQVRLIDAVCDAGEILAGRRAIAREQLRMRPLLERAVGQMRETVEARGIDLVSDLGLADEAVEGDADRIVQVFMELLRNAARCTPHGGRIRITAGSLRRRVVVVVEDNGRGLPPGFEDWIYDPLRAGDCGVVVDGMLGLGLAVTRALVRLHDGSVEIRSGGPGRGTTVTVGLPVVRSAPATI